MEQNDNCIHSECNKKLNGGNILSIVTVIRALSDAKFKPFIYFDWQFPSTQNNNKSCRRIV